MFYGEKDHELVENANDAGRKIEVRGSQHQSAFFELADDQELIDPFLETLYSRQVGLCRS